MFKRQPHSRPKSKSEILHFIIIQKITACGVVHFWLLNVNFPSINHTLRQRNVQMSGGPNLVKTYSYHVSTIVIKRFWLKFKKKKKTKAELLFLSYILDRWFGSFIYGGRVRKIIENFKENKR